LTLVDENEDKYNEAHYFRKKSQSIRKYFEKWSGQHKSTESSIQLVEYIITFIGTFIGLGIISFVHYRILSE
jgi:hypothetical protein